MPRGSLQPGVGGQDRLGRAGWWAPGRAGAGRAGGGDRAPRPAAQLRASGRKTVGGTRTRAPPGGVQNHSIRARAALPSPSGSPPNAGRRSGCTVPRAAVVWEHPPRAGRRSAPAIGPIGAGLEGVRPSTGAVKVPCQRATNGALPSATVASRKPMNGSLRRTLTAPLRMAASVERDAGVVGPDLAAQAAGGPL